MLKMRGALLALAVAGGTVAVPTQQSDAALFSCLRRVFGVPTCATCAPAVPVVQEGACLVPTATPVLSCTTTFVRRSYLEPRTCLVTQAAVEARPSYVRRYYWDPCACRYRTQLVAYTSYVKRYYQVPVTTYVRRSYLQPVTSCTVPSCAVPAPACPAPVTTPPVAAPPVPAEPPAQPATNEGSAHRLSPKAGLAGKSGRRGNAASGLKAKRDAARRWPPLVLAARLTAAG